MAADKSHSFYLINCKKTFTDLVTALLVLPSRLLTVIKINFLDQLRKPAVQQFSVSSSPPRFFVITEVLPTSSNTSNPATPTNQSPVMYTQSPQASNVDEHLIRITCSPCSSSSSSSSPLIPLISLPAEKPPGYDPAVIGGMRIIYMQDANPNPTASNQELSVFQKSDLSKVILVVVTPVTGGLLAFMSNYSPQWYSTLPNWLMPFVVCTLTFGSTFIILGILFRETFPRFAHALEEFGVAILLLGFFSLVTTVIPKNVVWAPWLSYVLILLAFAVLRFREAASGSSTTSK